MSDQLMKLCNYYFFDSNFWKNRRKIIIEKYSDKEVNELAERLEETVDNFIHKMTSYIDGNRNDSIRFICDASDDIITVVYFRLSLFMVYSSENPDKKYPLLVDTDKQVIIDSLINFWREYNHSDPLIFLA